jgi:hypothetical protein
VLGRLAHAVEPADPAQAALAALASGEPAAADRIERRAASLSAPAWEPYLLAQARAAGEAGEARRARAYLDFVGTRGRQRPAFWLVQKDLAERSGDAAALAEAGHQLAALAAESWPAEGWQWRGTTARQEILAARSAAGLQVTILNLEPGGAALDLRLDGATVATVAVAEPGARVTVPGPVQPGLHWLEVEARAGVPVLPGAVELLPDR